MSSFGKIHLHEIFKLRNEMNSILNRMLGLTFDESASSLNRWRPQTDLVETDTEYLMQVELPGLTPVDFEVKIARGNIVVSGTKKPDFIRNDVNFLLIERPYGDFSVVIGIPGPVDSRNCLATLNQGLLKIKLPKVQDRRSHEIPIPLFWEDNPRNDF